ncbi:Holliday junction resolvase RuvX, partial [Microbacterium sp.]|uniref:Holliday junction resolvase RuvX n=2 Tax=Microbacterium TaxID=33882 RepID=UPI003F9EB171
MTEFRRGVRIGIDPGRARVGVARVDPDGMLAVPVETVPRDERAIIRVLEIAAEYEPIEFVVGLPLNLRGDDTASTQDARDFAAELASRAAVPVRLVDERLSTVTAHQALRQSGRSQKGSRKVV